MSYRNDVPQTLDTLTFCTHKEKSCSVCYLLYRHSGIYMMFMWTKFRTFLGKKVVQQVFRIYDHKRTVASAINANHFPIPSNFSLCVREYLCSCSVHFAYSLLYNVHCVHVTLKLNDFVKQKNTKQLAYAMAFVPLPCAVHVWLSTISNCKTVMLMIDCQLTSLHWYYWWMKQKDISNFN